MSVEVAKAAIAAGVDFVSPMTYVPWEDTTRHLSPLDQPDYPGSWGATVDAWTSGDLPIPPDRILPGMAFYARRWDGASWPNRPATADPTEYDYADVYDRAGGVDAPHATWHPGPEMHSAGWDGRWWSFESAQSIEAKARYVSDRGLAGMSVWHLQHGALATVNPPAAAVAQHFFGIPRPTLPAAADLDPFWIGSATGRGFTDTVAVDGIAGFRRGDVAVAFAAVNDGGTPTPPDGWVLLGQTVRGDSGFRAFVYVTQDAADPAVWQWPSTHWCWVAVAAWHGYALPASVSWADTFASSIGTPAVPVASGSTALAMGAGQAAGPSTLSGVAVRAAVSEVEAHGVVGESDGTSKTFAAQSATNLIAAGMPFTVGESLFYNHDHYSVVYDGTFVTFTPADGTERRFGSARWLETVGTSATFHTSGPSFAWYGTRAGNRGIATVTVDGQVRGTVDCYSPSIQTGALLWSAGDLAAGDHTIVVTVTGRNTAATADRVEIDFFSASAVRYVPQPLASFNHNHTSVVYDGTTETFVAESRFGGSARWLETVGTTATFTIEGHAFEWYGAKAANRGIATVTIDGAAPVTVDCYAASTQIGALLFATDSLAPGRHTVVIEVTGRHASATADRVEIDYFRAVVAVGEPGEDPTVPVQPPPANIFRVAPYGGTLFGPAFGIDNIGHTAIKTNHMIARVPTTRGGTLNEIFVYFIYKVTGTSGGYGGGDLGRYRFDVYADNNGLPGTHLGRTADNTIASLGNVWPNTNGRLTAVPLQTPAAVPPDSYVWIEARNTHSDPNNNWWSTDDMYFWSPTGTRSPQASPMTVMNTSTYGFSHPDPRWRWPRDTGGQVQGAILYQRYRTSGGPAVYDTPRMAWPNFVLVYNDGFRDGAFQHRSLSLGRINPSRQVRQRIIDNTGWASQFHGQYQTVSATGVWLIAARDTDHATPLTVTLKNASGSTLRTVSATGLPVKTPNHFDHDAWPNGWRFYSFSSPVNLRYDQLYLLEASCTHADGYRISGGMTGWSSWSARVHGNRLSSFAEFNTGSGWTRFEEYGTLRNDTFADLCLQLNPAAAVPV